MDSPHSDQPTDDFSAAIYTTIAHSQELHKHLSEQLDPEEVEWLSDWHSEPKWAVGYTFIRAGLHHLRGWTMLARERLYVPCLALFRPMIEADIRGLWLCLQATDKELAEWRKNRTKFQFPGFRKMTSSVAKHANLAEDVLSAGQWEELCDFTHAGFGLIEHSLRMEANSQAFAVAIVEAMRRATTAGGISAYLFAEKATDAFFQALLGVRAAKTSTLQFLGIVLREYLKGEESHRELVKKLREKISTGDEDVHFEDELESFERKQYVDKKWYSKKPRSGQFEL